MFISTLTCKRWWRSVDLRPSYCVFWTFKMAVIHHLEFSYFHNIC